MNERHLSRGKRKDTGEWVTGYLLSDTAPCSLKTVGKCSCPHDGSDAYIFTWRDELHEYDEYEMDPDTHGRCTGLRDKNGTLIFEGDIARIDCKETVDICAVKWEHGGWRVFGDFFDDDPLYDFMDIEIEVIGNRWDNPELLKAKVTP